MLAKHLVFVSELGANFGHITPQHTLAGLVSSQLPNTRISFVLPKLATASVLEQGSYNYQLFQAPVATFAKTRANTVPASFAENLLLRGYTQTERLALAVKVWRDLLRTLDPGVVVFDYAPTAQIAAHGLGFKKNMLGNGFAILPQSSVIPGYFVAQASDSRLREADAQVLQAANSALEKLALPKFESTQQMFDCDEKFLISVREMDCYAKWRQDSEYFGFLSASSGQRRARWPSSSGKPRAFVYLNTTFPFLTELLLLLSEVCVSQVFIGGARAEDFQSLSGPNLIISPEPFDTRATLPECDLVVCHGGFGTVGHALGYGKPILILPLQTEQQMTAQQLHRHNLALCVGPSPRWPMLREQIVSGFAELGRLQENAQHYQSRYRESFAYDTCDQRIASILTEQLS